MTAARSWRLRYRPSASGWAECAVSEAAGIDFERCLQVRERHAFRGACNKRGWYYFATTGDLKWCESRWEMRVLRVLDHDPEVVGVGVQPFTLSYRDRKGSGSHTPDAFVRRSDGGGVVVDARPEPLTHTDAFRRQREATEAACREAGWTYWVASGFDPVFESNIEWLAAYRHALVDPVGCAGAVLDACSEAQQIGALVSAFPPAALCRPVVGHLLWRNRLSADLSVALSDRSLVTARSDAR